MKKKNFGGNVRFEPKCVLTPATEQEVLACLDEYRGRRIRAIGSLHSWSEVAVGDDVVLDLRMLNGIRLVTEADGTVCADIGAGRTIDKVLGYLRGRTGVLRRRNYTLRTIGMSGRQTIAGAIATATHGSGRASMSNYVTGVRVAAYCRETEKARIYEWVGGDQLLAARCGLGCTGIVLSVRMPVTTDYLIEEQTHWYNEIEEILPKATNYPRQQFYLIPWRWKWFAQHRRRFDPGSAAPAPLIALLHRIPLGRGRSPVSRWFIKFRRKLALHFASRPGPFAVVRRLFRHVLIDRVFNGALWVASGRLRRWSAVHWLHRWLFPKVTRLSTRAVDRSRHILMMRHDIYRHVEMELFVPAAFVVRAAKFVEWVLKECGGESNPMPKELANDAFELNVPAALDKLRGRYVHDHAITFRRVLRDETLISMTSGDDVDEWYAISLVTYQRDRAPFLEMAGLVAQAMAAAYRARPHWGKVFLLDGVQTAARYPTLPLFRDFCESVDPEGVFVNDFAARVLRFPERPAHEAVPATHIPGVADLAQQV